jgi:hypothetical protein
VGPDPGLPAASTAEFSVSILEDASVASRATSGAATAAPRAITSSTGLVPGQLALEFMSCLLVFACSPQEGPQEGQDGIAALHKGAIIREIRSFVHPRVRAVIVRRTKTVPASWPESGASLVLVAAQLFLLSSTR